jgi:hypothetical protein
LRNFLRNDKAVSITVGYLLFTCLLITFFIGVYLTADAMIVERPSGIVMEKEFADVANMISTTITDVYLIAPDNGKLETSFIAPTTIAGEYYFITAEPTLNGQVIGVTSSSSEKTVNVTLSGIANNILINGTTGISYDSRK